MSNSELQNESTSRQPVVGCTSFAYQKASVCVPVAVRPFANPGTPSVRCCNGPIIGTGRCEGAPGRRCTFTITQEICVEVPVIFGANTRVGPAFIECLGVTNTDCPNCDDDFGVTGCC